MIKKFFLAIFCLLPLVCHSNEEEIQAEWIQTFFLQEETEQQLIEATRLYLDFINKIGGGEKFPYEEGATLLHDDCRKIFNGRLFTGNRDDFLLDLLLVNETQGCWKVFLVDKIICPKERTSILRLMIKMEEVGVFTAIVILRYDENYLITEINEVFNRVGNSYDFEGENE